MKINGSHVLITHPAGEQTIFDMNDVQKGRFLPSGGGPDGREPRLALEFKSASAIVLDGPWVKDLWETIKNRAGVGGKDDPMRGKSMMATDCGVSVQPPTGDPPREDPARD